MFDNLIESNPKRSGRAGLGNGFLSLVVHGGLIYGGIIATAHAGAAIEERIHQVELTMQAPEQPKDEPPPPEQVVTVNPPPKGFQTLSIPVNIPVDIPPPTQSNFNAADFSGVGVEGGIARGVEGGTGPVISDQPYLEAVVEERPDRISSPPSRYPEILRQAGIEGRVLVEVVIDTMGRAERGSIRILSSTHQLFEAPARETVANSVYRPGRIAGRAVRVR
ncbi:MAG: TonB family protein, partial [Gemmatimonadales bacterium]|nr:TonB family protein [Gemmatimonadales bacterium]